MSEIRRVCAFYSRGPHFKRVMRHLRGLHPHAELVALTPSSVPREVVAASADRIEHTELAHYSARDLGALLRLRRQIRSGRYDLFVVMFDSPRLRLLSALSGARQRYCCTVDGRFYRMRFAFPGPLVRACWRGVRGRLRYARIRRTVHHRPVRREPLE